MMLNMMCCCAVTSLNCLNRLHIAWFPRHWSYFGWFFITGSSALDLYQCFTDTDHTLGNWQSKHGKYIHSHWEVVFLIFQWLPSLTSILILCTPKKYIDIFHEKIFFDWLLNQGVKWALLSAVDGCIAVP